MSPRSSLGLKENREPQFRQNPSVSPGRPSWLRPTGWSQWPQKRLFSGTCGSESTALAGSRYGTGGISSSPAPSLPLETRPLLCRERVVRPPVPDARLLLAVGWEPEGADAGPDAEDPAAGTAGAAGAAGAIPHVLQ